MIKEKIEYILENYIQTITEDYDYVSKDSETFKILKETANDLKDGINGDYLIDYSAGMGRWSYNPWITFFNPKITNSARSGYYVVYLFKSDMSGVYISLNFGEVDFKEKYGRNRLPEAASNFRSILLKEFSDIKFESMELDSSKSKSSKIADYENGNIYSIYYPKNNIPSDEKILEDLRYFLKLYNYLYEQKGTQIFEEEQPQQKHEKKGINSRFPVWLEEQGIFFDKNTIENYLLSLKVKPFVILTGNSGTGKTKLAQLFAKYLLESREYKFDKNYEVVAVGANWTDNRNIIGYYNTLLDKVEKTDTYRLIKKAQEDLDNPYFLILDEMNLSYVERYFSDFLSALESGEPMTIPGCSKDVEEQKDYDNLELPSNLFVVGTVNVDETTYMFSPKVLDRANVLEFKTMSVEQYMDMQFNNSFDERYNIDFLENPMKHISFKNETKIINGKEEIIEKIDINNLRKKYSEIKNTKNLWDILSNDLNLIHGILQKSGFDFGFRVTNEILSFLLEASYYEEDLDNFNWERYLDAQILQKILPKLHGSKNVIEESLTDLFEFCIDNSYFEDKNIKNIKLEELTEDNTNYYLSACKIYEMLEELDKSRYVSFIS